MIIGIKSRPINESFRKSFHEEYRDDVILYGRPPQGTVNIAQVDDMIAERLNILSIFDEMKVDTTNYASSTVAKTHSYLELVKQRLEDIPYLNEDNFIKASLSNRSSEYKRPALIRDHYSHFLLRLYFSTTPELKTWFISKEVELLRFRLMYLTYKRGDTQIIPDLVRSNCLAYERVENIDLELKGKANFRSKQPDNFVYCIEFEKALDLVRNRKVYINNGIAYVPSLTMISILCNHFKNELTVSLNHLASCLPDEENRIIDKTRRHYNTVRNRKKVVQSASGNLIEEIKPEDLDNLCSESYPPCMESIHTHLRKNHHLKYYGRLHYQLFLKRIGLSLEDSLKLFRDEFIQKIAPEKFDKEYKYGIRYNYGKEGKKMDFSAYSCGKIINSDPPGPLDAHGCPFKTYSQDGLRSFLRKKSIATESIETIITLAKEQQQCTVACSLYFQALHPNHTLPEDGIRHPNQFFVESRRYRRGFISQKDGEDQQMTEEEKDKRDEDIIEEVIKNIELNNASMTETYQEIKEEEESAVLDENKIGEDSVTSQKIKEEDESIADS